MVRAQRCQRGQIVTWVELVSLEMNSRLMRSRVGCVLSLLHVKSLSETFLLSMTDFGQTKLEQNVGGGSLWTKQLGCITAHNVKI
jgi:hypothetical protein